MINKGDNPTPLSPVERGEANVAKLHSYLEGLRQSGQGLPVNNDGEPNRTAIAAACGFGRNVLHINKTAMRLLDEFLGKNVAPTDPTNVNREEAHAATQATQIGVLEQRVIRLEQRLAVVSVERDELRAQLARYKVIEDDVLKKGRRVIP